jgi:hypothetical protein
MMRLLGLFLVCVSPLLYVYAQTNNPIISANNAVAQIDAQIAKKAYKETINLKWKPADAVKNPSGEYTQYTMRYLALNDGFGLKQIKVEAYENSMQLDYYCQGSSPIFAILYATSEGCANRYKVYYEQGQALKCLKQTSNCSGNELGRYVELKDEEKIASELNPFDMIYEETEEKINAYLNSLEEDANVYPLRKEIKDINSYAELLAFLDRHAPTFQDLDSLYTLLSKQPCPTGLTNSILNGDPTVQQALPRNYVHFVFRNCVYQLPYALDSEQDLQLIAEFKDFKTNIQLYPMQVDLELAQNFEKSFTNFSIEKIVIAPSSEMITITNNFKSWPLELYRNRLKQYPSIFANTNEVSMYRVVNLMDESDYNEKEEIAREKATEAFKKQFCTNTYAKNLSRFISAQVFGDLCFIYINNRWVFFDIER